MGRIISTLRMLDRLHWLWLTLAAPFLLFPSPKRSLAMLIVPMLWIFHWIVVKMGWEEGTPLRGTNITLPSEKKAAINVGQPALRFHSGQTTDGRQSSTFRLLPSVFPSTPLNSALLLILLMVLVSLWATFDITFSLPKISGMVLYFGIFFAIMREGQRPRGWLLSLLVFLCTGLGIGIVSLFGTAWFNSKITIYNPVIARLPRLISGLQGAESGFQPNTVAGALLWVLPMMIFVTVGILFSKQRYQLPIYLEGQANGDRRVKSRSREERKDGLDTGKKSHRGWLASISLFCLLATVFLGAVFLLTQSRGGYISLALTLLALLLIAMPAKWRWYSLVILVVLVIVLGFVVSSHWEVVRTWVTGNNLVADPALSLNSLQGRLEVWSRAIYGIQDFPFTGMGMGTFRKVVSVLYPLFTISPEIDIGHAHNEFLQAALDLGIPGLVAFLALYLGALRMLVEVWMVSRSSSLGGQLFTVLGLPSSTFLRATVLGLGGGLIAHMLFGLTDAISLGARPGLPFWMLLALICGLHAQVYASTKLSGNVVHTELPC